MLKRAFFLLLLPLGYTLASEKWKMPVTTWSQAEVERLLTDSPWAVRTEATMDDPADQAGRADRVVAPLPSVAPSGVPGRTYAGANDGRWDGGIGKNRKGSLATIPVIVRWDSAALIRGALERESPGAIPGAGVVQDHFLITVIGLLPAGQLKGEATIKGTSSSDDGARSGNRASSSQPVEETLEWFMSNSRLLEKGEPPLQPQNVKVDADTGTVHLYFPRSSGFLEHRRDVFFVTRYGAMSVQTKFRTKDMLVDGRPDL